MNNISNIKNKLFIAVFLLLLIVPNLVLIFGVESKIGDNENLKFKEFPKIDIKKPIQSLSNFKSYYLGNFGLKKTTVNQYINFKETILKEEPLPNYNLTGKDGWYFLGNHYNNVFYNSFGMTGDNKTKEIINYLNRINQYLNSKNIKFYVIFPPNKHSIYSEYLPFQLEKKETLYSHLKRELEKNSTAQLIDLHSVLLKEKKENQLYYKTDSHWNDLGAFIAYQHIIDYIKKDISIQKLELKDYKVSTDFKVLGDNTQMVNIKEKTEVINFEKKTPSRIEVLSDDQKFLHFKNESKDYKLILYRDSFSNALIPFFNETFENAIYIRNFKINKRDIENNNPDIVILELVERNINYLSKADLK